MSAKNLTSDILQKILGMELLWHLGYVVRPEVLITQQVKRATRSKTTRLDLTDLDVLGYRFDSLLSLETVCIDCGAGVSRSPMDRAFWLRGLKEAVDFDQVICVVGRAIEEEHRYAALRFGVQLIHTSEFQQYVDQLTRGAPLVRFADYYELNESWACYLKNFPGSFYDFLRKDNWMRDWNRIPVTVPGQLRRWTANLDLSKELHQHGLIELGLLLSIGLVKLAVHLFESRPSDFRGAVRMAVLGGDRQSRVIDQMVKLIEELERERGKLSGDLFSNGANKFEVPYLLELLEVLNRFVSKIGSAVQVPAYIQAFQLSRIKGNIEDFAKFLSAMEDSTTTKLALDVFRYLRIASESKTDFSQVFSRV